MMEKELLALLPEHAIDIARLQFLLAADKTPVVTVVGKYNHGKSRLLNALIGDGIFKVADKRETVQLAEHIKDGVRWLDAPGLDADVSSTDDRLAHEGIWQRSDIRLFVHSAKEGELDKREVELLSLLQVDSDTAGRETVVVLTNIDQVGNENELEKVSSQIKKQIGNLNLFATSSTRYAKGKIEGKSLLVERSGIPALIDGIARVLSKVAANRANEMSALIKLLDDHLQDMEEDQTRLLYSIESKINKKTKDFNKLLKVSVDKVREKFGRGI